jgi:hypothetical protein
MGSITSGAYEGIPMTPGVGAARPETSPDADAGPADRSVHYDRHSAGGRSEGNRTMTNTEPSKEKIDAEGFLDKVKNSFQDLIEVKVVTIVGDVPVTITTKGDSTTTTLGEKEIETGALITVVKLLDGDVTTVIPKDLVGEDAVRALHSEQVAASLEVIPRHLDTLVAMAERLLGR